MWTVWRSGSPAAGRHQQHRILWAELPTVFLIPGADVSSRCSCWKCDCWFHCLIGRQVQKEGRPAALFLRSSPSKADWLLWLQSMFFFKIKFRHLLSLFIRPHVSAPVPSLPSMASVHESLRKDRLCATSKKEKKNPFAVFSFHVAEPPSKCVCAVRCRR